MQISVKQRNRQAIYKANLYFLYLNFKIYKITKVFIVLLT